MEISSNNITKHGIKNKFVFKIISKRDRFTYINKKGREIYE